MRGTTACAAKPSLCEQNRQGTLGGHPQSPTNSREVGPRARRWARRGLALIDSRWRGPPDEAVWTLFEGDTSRAQTFVDRALTTRSAPAHGATTRRGTSRPCARISPLACYARGQSSVARASAAPPSRDEARYRARHTASTMRRGEVCRRGGPGMQLVGPTARGLLYSDTGDGPEVVVPQQVLMNGTLGHRRRGPAGSPPLVRRTGCVGRETPRAFSRTPTHGRASGSRQVSVPVTTPEYSCIMILGGSTRTRSRLSAPDIRAQHVPLEGEHDNS